MQAQADGRDFVRAGALAEACAALRAAGDGGAYLHVVARGADVHVPQADADIASAKARAQAAPSMSEERRSGTRGCARAAATAHGTADLFLTPLAIPAHLPSLSLADARCWTPTSSGSTMRWFRT